MYVLKSVSYTKISVPSNMGRREYYLVEINTLWNTDSFKYYGHIDLSSFYVQGLGC